MPVCCTQVLEGFGGRCGDVQLDGQATSRAEMDKVGGRLEVGGGRLEVRGGRPYQALPRGQCVSFGIGWKIVKGLLKALSRQKKTKI